MVRTRERAELFSKKGFGILHRIAFRLAERSRKTLSTAVPREAFPHQLEPCELTFSIETMSRRLRADSLLHNNCWQKNLLHTPVFQQVQRLGSHGSNSCYYNPDLHPRWLRRRPRPKGVHADLPLRGTRGTAPWYPSTQLSFSLV